MTQYTGTLISDLNARVDNTLAIHGARFLDNAEATLRGWMHPAMFLAEAMTALANRPMTAGDELAWKELEFLQKRLWTATDRCHIESENGAEGARCNRESITFCGSCGTEICSEHAVKCCMETFCVGCIEFHNCAVLG